MKKSALTVAAAIAMTAGSAHAATVFEGDGTKVDLHGRLRLALVSDDGDNSINNLSSRFGFRLNHLVNQDMSVFANTEWRFRADEKNSEPMTVRNTFLGVDFTDVGRVYAGNFDAIYYQQVSSVIDVPENAGFRSLNGGAGRAHGDSIAFDSADFGGFRFGLSAKHQPEDELAGVDEAISTQAYLGYTLGALNLVVGYDQANEDFVADGAEDALVGFRADYNVLSNLNVGALVEQQGDVTNLGLSAVYNYGMGNLYGIVTQLDVDSDTVDGSDTQYAVGVNYKFSKPMYVFAEYANSTDDETGTALDRDVITLGARYNF